MQVGGGGSERGSSLNRSALGALMSRRSSGGQGTMSEINVTPFVDVVLVLLIIFMITAPLLVRAMDVSLPAAGLRQETAAERTVVSIDSEGRTFVDDKAVNILLLEERLKEDVELKGIRIAYLRADENLRYKQIIQVMDLMKRAGIDTIGLVYVYPEEKGLSD